MFTTHATLIAIRRLCSSYGVCDDVRDVICSYLFITHDEAKACTRRRYDRLNTILISSASRRNGFHAFFGPDTQCEHWWFRSVEIVMRLPVTTYIGATSCARCGEYKRWKTQSMHNIAQRAVCWCISHAQWGAPCTPPR